MRFKGWRDALDEFLLVKQADGISETTLEDYRYHINLFFKRHPQAWNEEKLKRAVLEYMAEPIKPATYNIRRAYLGAFFKWCVKEGAITTNPLEGFKRRKDPGRIRVLEESLVRRLLELPDRKRFSGLRDYALMLLSLDTGIRPSEALQLLISDVDLSSCIVRVRPKVSKTRQLRLLSVTSETARYIKKLIEVRPPHWESNGY